MKIPDRKTSMDNRGLTAVRLPLTTVKLLTSMKTQALHMQTNHDISDRNIFYTQCNKEHKKRKTQKKGEQPLPNTHSI